MMRRFRATVADSVVQVTYAARPSVENPTFAGEGVTTLMHGVAVEQPDGWTLAQPAAKDKDTTLAVHHRSPGFGIDAGDKTGSVVLYQQLVLPAGQHGLQVTLFSHADPQGPYDASWQVAIIANDTRIESKPQWLDDRKGQRVLRGVVSCTETQTVTLELTYTVRYASVAGEMQIKRVQFTDTLPRPATFRLVVGTGTDRESGVNTMVDMWRYMIPAPKHEHELTTPRGPEFIRRGGMADDEVFVNKNQYWEHKLLRDGYVCHGADCSANNGREVYVPAVGNYWDRDGTYAQPWFPRMWSPGDTHSVRSYVVTYTHSGEEVSRATHDNHYRFEKLHKTYSFPSGRHLENVAEIHWRLGDPNKVKPDEVYLLARGMGYVGHWNQHGYRSHYKQDVVEGTAYAFGFRTQVVLPWLTLPSAGERYEPGEDVITIAKTDYGELMETLKKIKQLHQEVRQIEGVYEAIRDIEDLYQEVRELLPGGNG